MKQNVLFILFVMIINIKRVYCTRRDPSHSLLFFHQFYLQSLIGRMKDRVKNMFTSGFWGQGQDILRPSFFGALHANSQDPNNSNEKRTEENNVITDSMPVSSEVSLPLKSNNVLSMAQVPSQTPNLTATPIFPRGNT